jgi:hypothetical protein
MFFAYHRSKDMWGPRSMRTGRGVRARVELAAAAVACLLGACRPSAGSAETLPAADAGLVCAPGEMPLDSGSCQPAGLPLDMACPPGEMPLGDGSCQPAGVPTARCAAGFASDGAGSCEPILPAEPCAPGAMALPGELACHELAECGTGAWGDAPLDADTEYVDGSYAGNDSDGSPTKPWPTIQQGVDAATSGAVVAVAAGSYVEDVELTGKAVRIWGRCPRLVEIVGSATGYAPVLVSELGDGSELHNLALTGSNAGLVVAASEQLLAAGVWIHDTAQRGVAVENAFGPVELTLRNCLIERATVVGLALLGATVSLESVVVRDTAPGHEAPIFGGGLAADVSPYDDTRAQVTVSGSVVERTRDYALSIVGSDATIERSVIRDTLPRADLQYGRGVEIDLNAQSGAPSNVVIRQSVVERSHDHGVFVLGSELLVEDSVVRDGATSGLKESPGVGIGLWPPAVLPVPVVGATRSKATIRSSMVSGNALAGILVMSSEATIEATVVRDTEAWAYDQREGRGLDVEDWPAADDRSEATVRWSLLARNHECGVAVAGSDAQLEATVVRDTLARPADLGGGRGLNVQADPVSGRRASVGVLSSLFADNREIGLAVLGSDAVVEHSVVAHTLPRDADQLAGRGLFAQRDPGTGEGVSLVLRAVLVQDNREVGIGLGGGDATIEWSRVGGTEPGQADGLGGDGLVVQHEGAATTAAVRGTLIESSARVGIVSFGAGVSLEASVLECNAINLDGEPWEEQPYRFEDRGLNLCGCADSRVPCQVVSTSLQPPAPVPP